MVKHESVPEEGRERMEEDGMQRIDDEDMSPSQARLPRASKGDTASTSASKRTVKVAPEDRIPRR
ncbi:hypothetical protein CPB97_008616, partial [Podila verticillata]